MRAWAARIARPRMVLYMRILTPLRTAPLLALAALLGTTAATRLSAANNTVSFATATVSVVL